MIILKISMPTRCDKAGKHIDQAKYNTLWILLLLDFSRMLFWMLKSDLYQFN